MALITLFEHVITNNTSKVIEYLTTHRTNKRRKRARDLSIVYAAALGNAEMVKSMLEHGIPANTFDVFNNFQRTWEPRKLKKLQYLMEANMQKFTRGWAPILTPACVAAFYGHKNVLKILCEHDFTCMSFNPYSVAVSTFIGEGNPPEWNATTCALFGQHWDIASALVERGVITTDMEEQYPLFLEFRTKIKIPRDVITVVFSFL
tara:strand:+ start:188 stop:802 length:615 start_codon:yes stop_codon:yes gene_type:complete